MLCNSLILGGTFPDVGVSCEEMSCKDDLVGPWTEIDACDQSFCAFLC